MFAETNASDECCLPLVRPPPGGMLLLALRGVSPPPWWRRWPYGLRLLSLIFLVPAAAPPPPPPLPPPRPPLPPPGTCRLASTLARCPLTAANIAGRHGRGTPSPPATSTATPRRCLMPREPRPPRQPRAPFARCRLVGLPAVGRFAKSSSSALVAAVGAKSARAQLASERTSALALAKPGSGCCRRRPRFGCVTLCCSLTHHLLSVTFFSHSGRATTWAATARSTWLTLSGREVSRWWTPW
jgi:hypothetical protein